MQSQINQNKNTKIGRAFPVRTAFAVACPYLFNMTGEVK